MWGVMKQFAGGQQGIVGRWRFLGEHIQPRAGDAAFVQGRGQGRLVHQRPRPVLMR
jgi:hypothetical protein